MATEKCPHCGAPGGKAHTCRYRFTDPPKRKPPIEEIKQIAEKALRPKASRNPDKAPVVHVEPVVVEKRAPKLQSHPDCEVCQRRKEQQADLMRKRRAKA